jgi:Ca2+-binding RTX toxin-like protein
MTRRAGRGSLSIGASAVALALFIALAGGASAQETPICTKAAEKLSDNKDNWRGGNRDDSVTGLRANDHLDGGGGNDFVSGGRDSDVINGGPGNDVLCGGTGHDVIYGGPGNDKIYGEEANDTIIPGPGNDYALGSAGDDHIEGWGKSHGEIVDDGVDVLDGGYNDDRIEAGGADTLLGYTHDDVLLTKTPSIAPQLMDGGGNNDTIYGSDTADNMRGGERLSGDDKLYGAGGDDTIHGDGNDDQLYGQDGNDSLFGDDGFDFLSGGTGEDSCDGGDLRDIADECEHETSIERHGSNPRLFGRVGDLY